MNRLREYRTRLGVSQKMTAEMFDISQQMVSQIEQGKREIPTKILERMSGSTLMQDTPQKQKRAIRNSPIINTPLLQKDGLNEDFFELETSRKWEKVWWRTRNKLCKECTRECKQSNKTKIIACPQFERVDGTQN